MDVPDSGVELDGRAAPGMELQVPAASGLINNYPAMNAMELGSPMKLGLGSANVMRLKARYILMGLVETAVRQTGVVLPRWCFAQLWLSFDVDRE